MITITTAVLGDSVGGPGTSIEFEPTRLVVAGYTGRDRAAVAAHIAELEELGVAPPARVPTYFELPPALVDQGPAVLVDGDHSSGEVEPVLIVTDAGRFIAVGSDHTDREVEKADVHASKAACLKVISRAAAPYDTVAANWNACVLRSWAGDELYQEGTLGAITPVGEQLVDFETCNGEPKAGLVLFLGTIPLKSGAFEYTSTYRVQLEIPGTSPIECSYQVLRRN